MLSIRLDSPVPLGEQLVTGLRRLIAAGTLRPGDELPPVRQLAADLGINLNTVARAYRELETDGLVAPARGRGTRVTASRGTGRTTPAAAQESLRSAYADARLAGIDREGMAALGAALLNEFWPPSTSAAHAV